MKHLHNHTSMEPCTTRCPVYAVLMGRDDTQSYQVPAGHFEKMDDPYRKVNAEALATDGDAIVEARRSVYGDPTETYVRVAAIMSAILDHEVQPWQAPLLMVAVKLIRTAETPDYSDNSDDIDGYMKMFREIMGSDMVKAKSVSEYIDKKFAASKPVDYINENRQPS